MKAGRKPMILAERERSVMQMLWDHGPLFVREMVELSEEPKPHFNTLSTTVRNLEAKGYVEHETFGTTYRYKAVARREDFRERSLAEVVANYFSNSYKKIVSALVEEEKISVDELREIIDMVEKGKDVDSRDDSDRKGGSI